MVTRISGGLVVDPPGAVLGVEVEPRRAVDHGLGAVVVVHASGEGQLPRERQASGGQRQGIHGQLDRRGLAHATVEVHLVLHRRHLGRVLVVNVDQDRGHACGLMVVLELEAQGSTRHEHLLGRAGLDHQQRRGTLLAADRARAEDGGLVAASVIIIDPRQLDRALFERRLVFERAAGDMFRRLRVTASIDGHPPHRRWLGRMFAQASASDDQGFRLRPVLDDRVPAAESDDPLTIDLLLPHAPAGSVRWSIDLYRMPPDQARARGLAEATIRATMTSGEVFIEPGPAALAQ